MKTFWFALVSISPLQLASVTLLAILAELSKSTGFHPLFSSPVGQLIYSHILLPSF